MAKAIRRYRELDGDKWLVAPLVEFAPIGQDVIHHWFANGLFQKLVHDDPLVMPAYQALRLGEHLAGMREPEVALHMIHHHVVEPEHRHVQLRDDQVLVITRIAEKRGTLVVPRQVEARDSTRGDRSSTRDFYHEKLDALACRTLIVEMRRSSGAGSIHAVELEQRVPEVLDGFRIYLPFQTRSRVERHVVIEKLTEERHPRRERGVVRIVDVQRRVE